MSHPKFPVKTVPADMPENAVTERIIQCATEVHRRSGPGLPENIYEEALKIECKHDGFDVSEQIKRPMFYRGRLIGEYRLDLLINHLVIVEIKSVERFDPVFKAQVLTYLK